MIFNFKNNNDMDYFWNGILSTDDVNLGQSMRTLPIARGSHLALLIDNLMHLLASKETLYIIIREI